MPTHRRFWCATLGAPLLALSCTLAHAWTDKPITMVVPAPAGGNMDVMARILADQLTQELGKAVVVENKPGAGGAIAANAIKSAAPDGQTVMFTANNILTEIPHVMRTSFKPLSDVKPVAAVAKTGMVMVADPKLEPKDLKSFISYAKAHPGQLGFASYSSGTSSHYAGMIFNQKAGLDLQHIPFAGSPPALSQVIGGQIAIMFDGIVTSRGMIAAGKLQAYGVASKTRSPLLPDVPTLAEQGFAELNFSNWLGVVVASGVPADTVERMHATLTKVASAVKVRERMQQAGYEPVPSQTPKELSQSLQQDYERNAGIVKAFHIQLNP